MYGFINPNTDSLFVKNRRELEQLHVQINNPVLNNFNAKLLLKLIYIIYGDFEYLLLQYLQLIPKVDDPFAKFSMDNLAIDEMGLLWMRE